MTLKLVQQIQNIVRLELKLINKIGSHTHPSDHKLFKGFRPSRRLRFDMLAKELTLYPTNP